MARYFFFKASPLDTGKSHYSRSLSIRAVAAMFCAVRGKVRIAVKIKSESAAASGSAAPGVQSLTPQRSQHFQIQRQIPSFLFFSTSRVPQAARKQLGNHTIVQYQTENQYEAIAGIYRPRSDFLTPQTQLMQPEKQQKQIGIRYQYRCRAPAALYLWKYTAIRRRNNNAKPSTKKILKGLCKLVILV